MKRLCFIIVALVFALVLIIKPVMAYDTPRQDSTDNATDIILWHGDTANITISNNITEASVAGAQVIADAMEDLMLGVVALILVIMITAFAYLRKNSYFLKLVAVPVNLVYGLSYAATNTPGSSGWVIGIIVAIIGAYCLVDVINDLISRRRKKA